MDDSEAESDESLGLSLDLSDGSDPGAGLIGGATTMEVLVLDNDRPARLQSWLSDAGRLRLQATGVAGARHQLESSADLKAWSPEATPTVITAGDSNPVDVAVKPPSESGAHSDWCCFIDGPD